MTLEQQVISLELSKKLKEFGMKQESLFYWTQWVDKVVDVRGLEELSLIGSHKGYRDYVKLCSAFTVAELGEILPVNEKPIKTYKRKDGKYFIQWKLLQIIADTEADARAKMLIYLLENNLITL